MLSIERSGYYAWLKKQPGKRQIANQKLDEKIIALFHLHQGRLGSQRLTKELQEAGEICSKNRVAKRMKQLNLHLNLRKNSK